MMEGAFHPSGSKVPTAIFPSFAKISTYRRGCCGSKNNAMTCLSLRPSIKAFILPAVGSSPSPSKMESSFKPYRSKK